MPKVTELPGAAALGGTEIVPLVQNSTLKRSTAETIANTASQLDECVIGATTPAAGTFSTLATGAVTVSGGVTVSSGTCTLDAVNISGTTIISGAVGPLAVSGAVTISGSGAFTTTGDCILGGQTTHSIAFYGTSGAQQRASALQVSLSYSLTVGGFGFSTSVQASAFIGLLNEIQRTLIGVGLMKGGA